MTDSLQISKTSQPPTITQLSHGWLGNAFKRLFDIAAAALLLLFLSPFLGLIALVIKRDSPGPVFFRGARAGRGGKTFQILKFRTMHETAESYNGPRVTAQDDPRITELGRWLRDSKLNELPQLWNVLKGEMSLVGPRPEDPQIAAAWPEDVRDEILSVRPGITSPASVLYRDEEKKLEHSQVMQTYLDDIVPSKLRLDQLYVRHRSPWSDLDVLFWTALVLLPRMGETAPPEARLFLGPISRLMRRYVSWFFVDTLITFLAMGLAGLIWRTLGPLDIGRTRAALLALGFAGLFSLAGALLGINRISWSKAAATDALDLVPGTALATILGLIANHLVHITYTDEAKRGLLNIYWSGEALLPSGLILTGAGLALTGYVMARYRTRLITGLATRWVAWRGLQSSAIENALIIGGGESGQFAAWMLNNRRKEGKLRVVGFVDDDLYKQDIRIHGVNVIGQREDIPRLVAEQDVGVLVFAIHNISSAERQRLLNLCTATQARVVMFPDIPAAMETIQHNPGADGQATAPGGIKAAPQAYELQPLGLPPAQVETWLAQLDALAEQGDLAQLKAEIQALRSLARAEREKHMAAKKSLQAEDTQQKERVNKLGRIKK